ncbi:hypothetical protein [Amycolatopsis regifaucium]|uniref:Uncharacterized protein n=1 Tax=Amycolatopsis regifaucium TaxID=546365 RepID=A0A154M582_9PSEU|nr:hypothetical protein [Amycolatopsis regifaucium]KZB79794.1 hypothetical protein AVL48_15535 [Amycolatopsis regifaucium]OKA09888.1 hypothetical protein ATP06_0205875 [Amycolatopsis regifaucium]SFI71052.1 hypothetical protein SAMN04489731_112213 [Amycolatopsis regifaucium]
MYIHARRRSIRFSGRTITIKAAVKGLGDRKHTFSVGKINGIKNIPPTAFKPGRLVFDVPGASKAIVEDVPMYADKVDMNTFTYGAMDAKNVQALEAAIRKAMTS